MQTSKPLPAVDRSFSAPPPPASNPRAVMAAILVGLFAVGLVAVAILFRPWSSPAIGYDSAASVLYFDRLAARQSLEAFVGTTPKPFITALYGLAFNLAIDWRLVSLVSTIEFPAMLAAAAALALRTSGPVAAGMAAFGLLGCQRLLLDGALTYANPWAILLWAIAGLALTAGSPRYGLAGIALFLAALMRIETFIILAVAVAALAAWRFLPARWIPGGSRPPARAILLLVGVAALPVMVLHDWLLTGNGFFWIDVSSIVSRTYPGTVMTPPELTRDLAQYYATAWPLALLAAVAVVDLVRRRRAVVLLGLIACGPGVLAFLELLALRNTYVSYRYTIPADAALVFGAALGAEVVVRSVVRIAARRRAAGRRAVPDSLAWLVSGERNRDRLAHAGAAVAIGGLVAVACVSPYGPLDRTTWRTIGNYRALQANAERVLPTISGAIAKDPPTWMLTDIERPNEGPPPRLYVPALLVPGMAVDLGLPVWAVRDGSPIQGDPSALAVGVTTIVYIDAHQSADAPGDDQPLEVDRDTQVGHVTVRPLLALPGDGIWVVELSPI